MNLRLVLLFGVACCSLCHQKSLGRVPPKPQPVIVAYSNVDMDKMDTLHTLVLVDGRAKHFLDGPWQVRQWVPAWSAFALMQGGVLYSWRPGQPKPERRADITKRAENEDKGTTYLEVSVSPSGKLLAFENLGRFGVLDLQSGRLLVQLTWQVMKQKLHKDPQAMIDQEGMAWDAGEKRVAFGLGLDDRDQTNGSTLPVCVFADLQGNLRVVGKGCPIAWLTDSRILCGEDQWGDEPTVSPVVIDTVHNTRERSGKWGLLVGRDGHRVYLATSKGLRVLDDRLRPMGGALPLGPYQAIRNALGLPPTLVVVSPDEWPRVSH